MSNRKREDTEVLAEKIHFEWDFSGFARFTRTRNLANPPGIPEEVASEVGLRVDRVAGLNQRDTSPLIAGPLTLSI